MGGRHAVQIPPPRQEHGNKHDRDDAGSHAAAYPAGGAGHVTGRAAGQTAGRATGSQAGCKADKQGKHGKHGKQGKQGKQGGR